jgi:hypothetical protein
MKDIFQQIWNGHLSVDVSVFPLSFDMQPSSIAAGIAFGLLGGACVAALVAGRKLAKR